MQNLQQCNLQRMPLRPPRTQTAGLSRLNMGSIGTQVLCLCSCMPMYAHVHACMQARNSRVCECMRVCMHACMHACKRLRVCLCLAYNNVSHNTHTRWTKRKRSWSRSIPYHAGFKDGSHHLDGRQCVQGERKGEEYTMHAHSFYSIIQCMLTTIANKGRETNLKLKIKKKITR
jgi:hypothetical protein